MYINKLIEKQYKKYFLEYLEAKLYKKNLIFDKFIQVYYKIKKDFYKKYKDKEKLDFFITLISLEYLRILEYEENIKISIEEFYDRLKIRLNYLVECKTVNLSTFFDKLYYMSTNLLPKIHDEKKYKAHWTNKNKRTIFIKSLEYEFVVHPTEIWRQPVGANDIGLVDPEYYKQIRWGLTRNNDVYNNDDRILDLLEFNNVTKNIKNTMYRYLIYHNHTNKISKIFSDIFNFIDQFEHDRLRDTSYMPIEDMEFIEYSFAKPLQIDYMNPYRYFFNLNLSTFLNINDDKFLYFPNYNNAKSELFNPTNDLFGFIDKFKPKRYTEISRKHKIPLKQKVFNKIVNVINYKDRLLDFSLKKKNYFKFVLPKLNIKIKENINLDYIEYLEQIDFNFLDINDKNLRKNAIVSPKNSMFTRSVPVGESVLLERLFSLKEIKPNEIEEEN